MSLFKNKELAGMLDAWESTYKKGQLTLWLFLALKDGEKYVDEIREFIVFSSCETIVCEEQSLYRMLRKFKDLGLLSYRTAPGAGGPERKYYRLTPGGEELLHNFCERNMALFYKENIKNLMFRKL